MNAFTDQVLTIWISVMVVLLIFEAIERLAGRQLRRWQRRIDALFILEARKWRR